MKKTLQVITAFSFVGFLAGCNTMEGLGEDIQGAGESLESSAKENK